MLGQPRIRVHASTGPPKASQISLERETRRVSPQCVHLGSLLQYDKTEQFLGPAMGASGFNQPRSERAGVLLCTVPWCLLVEASSPCTFKHVARDACEHLSALDTATATGLSLAEHMPVAAC